VTDPIGAVGQASAAIHASRAADVPSASAIVERIADGIDRARALGVEAERAAAGVRAGDAPDVEGIILATRKAEAAFRMLEAVRNATFEAYAQVRDAGR
jgi:flagellar hook-basal body complex protein FliE